MASKGGRRPRRRQSMKLFSCIAPWRRSRKKASKVTFHFLLFSKERFVMERSMI